MSGRIRRVDGLRSRPPTYKSLRITIYAREELEENGNHVEVRERRFGVPVVFDVTLLGIIPRGLVACLIGHGTDQHRGLRMTDEPKYHGEGSESAVVWHECGQWVPCPAPRCGRALVWYEAGYVPGYRICTAGHHAQFSDDGRSAKVVRETSSTVGIQ